jgi:L-aspartate oxidase
MHVDYIVVGAGIAGLTSAYELAQHGTVWVLSKSSPANITTTWAKGGIASVMSPSDSVHLHRQDTLIAGCGRCDPDRVDILVTEGPDRIRDLVAMGVDFDREPGPARGFHLGHEAAHQQRRILHVGDQTGRNVHAAMYRAASQHSRIKIWDQATVVELLCHAGTHGVRQCYGCVVYVNGQRHTMQAKAVVLATGGAAHMYAQTSAPAGCYGDGIGLAHQAGAAIRDMAFVQFHPTVVYGTNFLVSEVVRGEGARLRDLSGAFIMDGVHPDKDLAPRDVVSRAVTAALHAGSPHVWLDMTLCSVPIAERFPALYDYCMAHGFDPNARLPVVPAAHYTMGGVHVDENGETTIAKLYAVGEVASTGVHGANRLASNSLLEGLVFGYRAARHIVTHVSALNRVAIGQTRWPDSLPDESGLEANSQAIRDLMSESVGIIRTRTALVQARDRVMHWQAQVNPQASLQAWSVSMMLSVAMQMIADSLAQTQNCGSFYCTDLA